MKKAIFISDYDVQMFYEFKYPYLLLGSTKYLITKAVSGGVEAVEL